MAHENNSASAANLNSPADPKKETRGQFLVHFKNDRFFHVSYPNNPNHSHSAHSHSRKDQKTHGTASH